MRHRTRSLSLGQEEAKVSSDLSLCRSDPMEVQDGEEPSQRPRRTDRQRNSNWIRVTSERKQNWESWTEEWPGQGQKVSGISNLLVGVAPQPELSVSSLGLDPRGMLGVGSL